MHSAASCLGLEPSSWKYVSKCYSMDRLRDRTHLVILLLLVLVVIALLIILVVLILKVILVEVIKTLLELQSLAGEPVDGTRNELLLDVLTELVIELKLLLNVLVNLVVLI